MDTIVVENLTQTTEVTTKRKRPLDLSDNSERPRKQSHTSQGSNSSTTISAISAETVTRTDSDATAVGSNSSSQASASNPSCSTVVGSKTMNATPSRSHARPPAVSSAGLVASMSSPKPLGSRILSRPTVLGNSVVVSAAPPSALSAHQVHDAQPPVATLIPDASNVSATDFQPPEPVVVVSVSLRYLADLLLTVARWRQAYAALHGNYLNPLPWGVQWEIARYVNTGFDYHRFRVDFLRRLVKHGRNATAAPEVTKFVEDERRADKARSESETVIPDAPVAAGDSGASDEFAAAYAREQSARVCVILSRIVRRCD